MYSNPDSARYRLSVLRAIHGSRAGSISLFVKWGYQQTFIIGKRLNMQMDNSQATWTTNSAPWSAAVSPRGQPQPLGSEPRRSGLDHHLTGSLTTAPATDVGWTRERQIHALSGHTGRPLLQRPPCRAAWFLLLSLESAPGVCLPSRVCDGGRPHCSSKLWVNLAARTGWSSFT